MSYEATNVSGVVQRYITTLHEMSGISAVCFASGGAAVIQASRSNIGSGRLFPAIGVVIGSYPSGAIVPVVMQGPITTTVSGLIASGGDGRPLYLGSGGRVISQSGFVDGASSGHGAAPTGAQSGYSGCILQQLGVSISGGMWILPTDVRSGLISGALGQD